MKKTVSILTATLFGATGLIAHAETVNINQNGSLVEMCASANEVVAHDTGSAAIDYSVTRRDKKEAADEVNRVMGQSVRTLKQNHPKIEWQNGYYQTYQEHDSDGKPLNKWTVRQSYQISGHDLDEITDVAARLQSAGVNVGAMSTYLSPEGRRAAQKRLNESALADVQVQIVAIAKAFGQSVSDWRVAHMNTMPTNPCNGYGRVYAKAASMVMEKPAADRLEVARTEMVAGQEEMAVNFYIAVRAK